MKKMLIALIIGPFIGLAAATVVLASEAGYRLDTAPIDPQDSASLQAGARTFANYCMNCHGAQFLRYNRLSDIGLTEAQIKDNLLFAGDRIGDTMKTSMTAKDGKAWFGVAPPDLTVIARSRGSDWLYTYLRTFYRDPKTSTGWNNAVFENVGMPHALWTLQGERALEIVVPKGDGHQPSEYKWTQLSEGRQTTTQYDTTVRDLVNYLVWMGEPAAIERKKIGVVVLYFLGVLFVLAYAMKREFWKDVN